MSYQFQRFQSNPKDQNPPHPYTNDHVQNLRLRDSSQNKSPLRTKDPYQEEVEYERRRQHELQKALKAKDQELAHLNKAQDYLRHRIDNQKGPNETKYASFGRQLPEKDQQQPPMRNQHSDFNLQPPSHIREHIANLQSDNASLMRRLNLVLQELERVQREKEEIQQKMASVQGDSISLQKLINGEDNIDKVNKFMQDDLGYERERNFKIREKLKVEEQYRNDLLRELERADNCQHTLANNSQNINSDLAKKLHTIQELEQEHYYLQEKTKQINAQIEQQRRDDHLLSDENVDIQRIVNSLLKERNELLNKQEQLTFKYDEIVKEITQDRREMDRQNRHHNKLITAKLIFQELTQVEKTRKREAFQEFKIYCNFDIKCHKKLQQFAKIIQQQGHYVKGLALQRWFSKALKPIDCKIQSFYLAEKIRCDTIISRSFYQWRRKYDRRVNSYGHKNQAIDKLIKISAQGAQGEMKRAFLIWKDELDEYKTKQSKIKKLILRLYNNKLSQSFHKWKGQSDTIAHQVRLHLLAMQFQDKQYKAVLFHNLKYFTFEMRRKRQNILFHCVKYWKDHINQKKYLMSAQVQVLAYMSENSKSILKQCFDALKQNKELEKVEKAEFLLNAVESSQISDLQSKIKQHENATACQSTKRAMHCMGTMANKQVYSYFMKWKNICDGYNVAVNDKIKSRILQFYYNNTRAAFQKWKMIMNSQQIQQSDNFIMEQQDVANSLTEDIIQVKKENAEKKEQLDCSSRKSTNKVLVKFQKRQVRGAFARWREVLSTTQVKEDGAEVIIKRLRNRILKRGFEKFKAGVKEVKKGMSDEERCAYYNKTRNERLLLEVFNSWRLYKQSFKKSKDYWYRIFLRMDRISQEIAFKKWKEGAKIVMECQLEEQQNQVVSQIAELNNQLGQRQEQLDCSSAQSKHLDKKLKSQAQRILANAFASFFYTGETRGFEKWKEYTEFQKNRERLLKKTIDRWRKRAYYHVKASFTNWMRAENIKEKQQLLKQEEMNGNDATFQYEKQTKEFAQAQTKLNTELTSLTQMQQDYNRKLQKSIQMIVRKGDQNHYICLRRHILLVWREFTQKQKAFIQSIKTVIQKSLWSQGFAAIKATARQDHHNQRLDTVLNRFRAKFWKRVCGNAFSTWRTGTFDSVSGCIRENIINCEEKMNDHQERKELIKQTNQARCFRFLQKQGLKNLFTAWNKVSKHFKQQRQKSEYFDQQKYDLSIKFALMRWRARKNATKVARLRCARLKEKFQKIRTRLVFNAMKVTFFNAKDFMARMSNLANIHDQQGLKMGYNAIISYAKSKKYVHDKAKAHSSNEIHNIFNNLLQRRMGDYFNTLRFRAQSKHTQATKKVFTVLNQFTNRLRQYFLYWKNKAECERLEEEMNDEGPIREQVFEEKMLFDNCVNFMNKEGYDEHDIKLALKEGQGHHNHLLLKGVRRMQHFNTDLFAKPKYFDRWRQYVHLKKLFRYWLQYASHRQQYVKCDLAVAFKKWKELPIKSQLNLKKLSKAELEQRVVGNCKKLDALADVIEEKEGHLGHLKNQREELIENVIKGQKLAIGLWLNQYKKAKHQAFLRWHKIACGDKLGQMSQNLRKNIDIIAALKERIRQLENDNDVTAAENEELRQFSLDGYEIAKSVQALSQEREKLSVDLADKAQTIKKLLDENEKLNKQLRYAQEEAANLIKSTGMKMKGGSQDEYGSTNGWKHNVY